MSDDTIALTRSDLDNAYLELSQQTGHSSVVLRDAVAELAGKSGRETFSSLREEAAAVAKLASMELSDPARSVASSAADAVADEINDIALSRFPEFFDARKRPARASDFAGIATPAPDQREPNRPATAEQQREIDRIALTHISSSGGVNNRPDHSGTLSLSNRNKVEEYVALSQGSADRTDVLDDTESVTNVDAEVRRYLAMHDGMFGQESPQSGNRRYDPLTPAERERLEKAAQSGPGRYSKPIDQLSDARTYI